jgi:hypothetical protein
MDEDPFKERHANWSAGVQKEIGRAEGDLGRQVKGQFNQFRQGVRNLDLSDVSEKHFEAWRGSP